LWLDAHHEFTQTELVELSGLSLAELQHLVDCEALSPVTVAESAANHSAAEARFSADCLALVRAASRLRSDFDLDANGLTMTLRLLNRIRELEAELDEVRAQSPRPAR
ncbi:MAG TPA: chaperone modulator CbpM, partial [Burkholderiales bacterium]|nr:chaperone modulator CbpM [Burkholderiales bacterium]